MAMNPGGNCAMPVRCPEQPAAAPSLRLREGGPVHGSTKKQEPSLLPGGKRFCHDSITPPLFCISSMYASRISWYFRRLTGSLSPLVRVTSLSPMRRMKR